MIKVCTTTRVFFFFLLLITTFALGASGVKTGNLAVGNVAVDSAPSIGNVAISDITETTATVSFTVDQSDANTIIHYGTTSNSLNLNSEWNNESGNIRDIKLSGLSAGKKYFYRVYAYNSKNTINSRSSTKNFETIALAVPTTPKITNINLGTISNDSTTISFDVNQSNAKTIVNYGKDKNLGIFSEWNNETGTSRQITISDLTGNTTYYYSVIAYNGDNLSYNSNSAIDSFTSLPTNNTENINNINNETNNESILPNTGNRIWDETKNLNTTYIWNAYSFSGFYYDLDNNLSTENLVITNIQRNIPEGNIVYTTSPVEVDFTHSAFGSYNVIGFMADKYFAGYTSNSTISNNKIMNVMSSGQLLQILLDDDDKRTVSEGGTLTLQGGYVLKLQAVDIGAGPGQILLVLLKDGREVDTGVVSAGQDYIYTKSVGGMDLPIIAIHFDSVFRGTEVNAAFVRGIFQISDEIFSVKSGDQYGLMEVSDVTSNEIKMDNKDNVGLSTGETINLMGNLDIIVADSDTLRFALSVVRKGEYEARGTIYPVTRIWTPYNFGLNVITNSSKSVNVGFYYDLDEDIGTENLQLNSISGDTIPQGGLTYSTSPQEVNFIFPDFGKYQVIGFMADKYFAGYTANTNPPDPTSSIGEISAISQGELHKILIDDDDKRTVSIGGTLTLQDGYVIKAKDIDANARTMLVSLFKDGTEVDTTPLSAGQTYIYEKKVGSIDNLPLIMMRFDSVFSGTEVQAAFVKGLFQISEETTSVKSGDNYGSMEISSISNNGIEMTNQNSIGLSPGSTFDLMGNIKFKVADSSDLRFYPFVLVTPNLVSNQLMVEAPVHSTGGDTININVTAGGVGIDGVSIDIEPNIGTINQTTDQNGIINYTFPKSAFGTYNITATKTGYQSGNATIQIERYIAGKLNIIIPSVLDQFETIPIKVTSNNTNISNATIMYDNTTVGYTDNNGVLNFKLNSSGNYTITASKESYIPISLDINVRAPFSDFRAKDINITPNNSSTNNNVLITSNITNVGTEVGTKSIDLVINGSEVANKTVTISPNELQEVNFTYKFQKEGNYTVEILGQKKSIQIFKAPFNFLSVGIILTVIGAFVVYLLTRKSTTTIGEYLVSVKDNLKNKYRDRKNGRTL